MGTHPIFESDFDCLTERMSRVPPGRMDGSSRHSTGGGPMRNQPGSSQSRSNPYQSSRQSGGDLESAFKYCPDKSTKYKGMAKIGQGTFGEVWKARCIQSNRIVALKKVLMENEREGFPITALREIKILQQLRHENVVELIEICRTKPDHRNKKRPEIHLVFEFCEHDLAGLLANKHVQFTLAEKKKVIQQLLEGLYWVHKNKILHRDMKAANILINKEGILKLADFGLARPYSIPKRGQAIRYTNRVVTLWYRPPELLLGAREYGPPIDVWGAGCVMAEMWTRLPIMQGKIEQDQLVKIQKLCGGINPNTWKGVEEMPLYNKMTFAPEVKNAPRIVSQRLKLYIKDANALDLIEQLLTLEPTKRIDCDTALNHDFFWTDPMPEPLTRTLSKIDKSLFEYLVTNPRGANRPAQGPMDNNDFHSTFDRTY